MRIFIIWMSCVIFAMQSFAQNLILDDVPEPMKSFYDGCLALNKYVENHDVETIERAMTLLNPYSTKIDSFDATLLNGESLCEAVNHIYYDYTYAKHLYEDSGALYQDNGIMRNSSECHVGNIILKPHSSVKYVVDIYGGEMFRMFVMCEPKGLIKLSVEEKCNKKIHNGTNYEHGTVSYLSWFMSDDDAIIISISNISDIEESIVIATN